MSTKGRKRQKKASIEDIYCNNNFVPPKEQNLETIFEEPRQSKDGAPVLTSVRKYKRYLHFDDTQNKIQKRKRNAKKCAKKLKTAYRITRSSPKNSECDVSLYILNVLGDSSSDSDTEIAVNANKTYADTPVVKAGRRRTARIAPSELVPQVSCSDEFNTPKRKRSGPNSYKQSKDPEEISSSTADITSFDAAIDIISTNDEINKSSVNAGKDDTFASDVEELNVKKDDVESPRRSCLIS